MEGFELQVFEGAKNTIQKFKPMIQIEVHPDYLGRSKTRKFLEFLKNENYEIKYFIQGKLDSPMIGTRKDIKKYSVGRLLEMSEDGTLLGNFLVFLENKSRIQN